MHAEDMEGVAAEMILCVDATVGQHAAAVEDFFYSASSGSPDEEEAVDMADDNEDEEEDVDYDDDADADADEEEDGEFEGPTDDQDCGEGEHQREELRKAILAIQADADLSAVEKSKRIQALMTARWQASKGALQKQTSHSEAELSEADKRPTYHESQVLGCEHYQRGAKLKARCCGQWYTCRFCHDEANDHTLVRHDTDEMMCMHCNTIQPVGQDCADCGERLAQYYCGECKFWDDDARKNIYHCADCKVCRVGKAEDLFHCKTCNACMTVDRLNNHKCIERILESDCPICGDFMFTSTATVMFMPCGHCIHYFCHSEYIQTSSTCPTCYKSLGNMSSFNERIDAMLAQQVMPPEYDNFVSHILCNDCEKRSDAKYHFLYHKCAECGSYNTKLLQTLQVDRDGHPSSAPPAGIGAAADMARELEQASNPLPESPFVFNRRSASDRGAEGTEHLAGAGDGGSIISNSRIRSGSVASSSHRPSIASTDVIPVTTIIDYDEPDFD